MSSATHGSKSCRPAVVDAGNRAVLCQKGRKTRSKTGCFTCRLKRMKCDEQRPVCGRCKKNSITCVWPKEGAGKLTKQMREAMRANRGPYGEDVPQCARIEKKEFINYSLDDSATDLIKLDDRTQPQEAESDGINLNSDFFWAKMFDVNFTKPLMTPGFGFISPISSLTESSPKQEKALLMSEPGEPHCQPLDNEQTGEIYSNLLQHFQNWSKVYEDDKLLSVANILSRFQFTEQELLLYFTCVHYFFPAIGPQPTLPQLSTTKTFLPLIRQNPVVVDVFLCCGATFLEWCQPQKYSELTEHLYQKSKKKLKGMIEDNTIRGDETWAFACFQLLCLTDKFRRGPSTTSMTDRCVDNLAHSFNIIKKKIPLIKTEGSTTTDRCLIESFIYNYTVSLLVAGDLSKLPSPFGKGFLELTKLLESPLFDGCDVKWINNPILGSSLDAFVMLAKVSYLSRLPLPLQDVEWLETAKTLLEECLYYTPPSLPLEVKNDPEKYAKYRPSLLCGSIITKACYLLLSKITRYDHFNQHDFEIQGVVQYAIKSICEIEKGSPLLCILLWSLLVIGAFTVDEQDRILIRQYLLSVSETVHTYGALKITEFLELIWKQEDLDLLFIRENLSQVVI